MASTHRMAGGLTAVALASALGFAASTAVAGPEISGFVNSSFNYDLNNPRGITLTGIEGNGVTAGRSYDMKHNTFQLNNAHVAFNGEMDMATYTIELDMGADANVHRSGGLGTADQFEVQEAYVTVVDPIVKKFFDRDDCIIKVGKFATFAGIEVIESADNPTISRGYLYGGALGVTPEAWTHVGAVMTSKMGPVGYSVGVINDWDAYVDSNDAKMGVANVNFEIGDLGMLNLTGYSGAPGADAGRKMNSLDATGMWKFVPNTDLWWQVNYGDLEVGTGGTPGMGVTRWGGATLQPVVSLNEEWSVGLRYEYLEASTAGAGPMGTNAASTVQNGTIALRWAFAENVLGRIEFRHDEASMPMFEDSHGNLRMRTNTIAKDITVTF